MSRASKSREETPPMNGGASSIVRFAGSRALLVTCCSLSFPNLRRAPCPPHNMHGCGGLAPTF